MSRIRPGRLRDAHDAAGNLQAVEEFFAEFRLAAARPLLDRVELFRRRVAGPRSADQRRGARLPRAIRASRSAARCG